MWKTTFLVYGQHEIWLWAGFYVQAIVCPYCSKKGEWAQHSDPKSMEVASTDLMQKVFDYIISAPSRLASTTKKKKKLEFPVAMITPKNNFASW